MNKNRKTYLHNVPAYWVNPAHPITINLVGCGGTGSHLLPRLAQINHALKALEHPGLFVRVFDPDTVSEANIGRQGYFSCDIGLNKAMVLVSRVNRAFGLNWEAVPTEFTSRLYRSSKANLLITCIDTGAGREQIAQFVHLKQTRLVSPHYEEHKQPFYWLDCGNSKNTGQVILGTLTSIKQPKRGMASTLPTITDRYPNLHLYDGDNVPSCSVAESLQHQDLCINSMVAEWAKKLIWNLFKRMRIDNQGVFINLDTMTVNPIPITKIQRP